MSGNDVSIPSAMRRTVVSVDFFTDSLFELVLDRGELSFEPGDCVTLYEAGGESRPYSIASGTGDDTLRFLIRHLPGGRVSSFLAGLKPGDPVQISEPFGWFRPGQTDGEPFVFVATGTGMAPFLSYLRSVPDRPPIHCLWGVRALADAVQLERLAETRDVRLAISREDVAPHFHGRVTALLERHEVTDWPHYFLCGLDLMITETTGILEAQGCPITKLHREVFFHG